MDGPNSGGSGNFDLGGVSVSATLDWSGLKSGLDASHNFLSQWENQHKELKVKLAIDTTGASQSLSQFAAGVQAAPPFQLKAALDFSTLQSQFQQAGQQLVTTFTAAGQQAAQQIAASLQSAVNQIQFPQVPSPGGGGGGAPGSGGSGGGGGLKFGGMANRMVGRMILSEVARAPIEHVFDELRARQELDWSEISGSTSETNAATLKVLDTDTSGAWKYLMPGEASQAMDLRRSFASEQAMQSLMDTQQATAQSNLMGESYVAGAAGDNAGARKLARQHQFNERVNRATETARAKSEKFNASGKRDDATRAHGERLAKIREAVDAYAEPEAVVKAAEKRWMSAERNTYQTELRKISNQERAYSNERRAAIDEATQEKAAAEKEDADRLAMSDVRSKHEAGGIRSAASSTLAIAKGGGAAAELDAYNTKLKERLDLLRDIEKHSSDKDDIRHAKELADAQEAANQKLSEAKRIELERKKESVDLSLMAKSEGLDVGDLQASGSPAAATRLRASNEAAQMRRSATTRFKNGEITLKQLGTELYQSLRIAGQGDLSASQQEAMQAGELAAEADRQRAMQAEMDLRPRDAARIAIDSRGEGLRARYNSKGFDKNSEEGKSIKAKLDTLDASKRLQEFKFHRSDEEKLIGLNASIRSAQFAQKDQPLAAQATEAVAASKLAIERARDEGSSPEVLKKAQEAQIEHLKSVRHEMTAQHGGEFAINGGHGIAAARVLLTRANPFLNGKHGGGNDRDSADKELATAIRDLTVAMRRNQPVGGHPINPPQ